MDAYQRFNRPFASVPATSTSCSRNFKLLTLDIMSRVQQASTSTSSPSSSSTSTSPEYETTSKLDLHHLPDDKPVFACHKCSEVIASPSDLGLYKRSYMVLT